ncbi:hypothetical protein HanRHA438_Chr04g0165451 [Helianthus annuus]|uniref:Uncharacterized protein n=1 Tax=Helianthus annuus TaxID=4232 RepID=A0A9K3J6I3_HELAN|nr:hypothetical protein HanXRQr2_Chr04g0155301 [Helianthus annuus]KAJ0587801.1 hypothetical protein HanIR_Chr04g0167341 [Helianthus annuus]KAJ0925945.1 hypothetical protein HanRHA438_Chr04g0165451 [Helianthus annuus]KAJ0930435.1 hypothetical protein HanPSC8_Chr04g0149311 [Helianthus annuus]
MNKRLHPHLRPHPPPPADLLQPSSSQRHNISNSCPKISTKVTSDISDSGGFLLRRPCFLLRRHQQQVIYWTK